MWPAATASSRPPPGPSELASFEQRARRLLRCYPRSWRTRYGAEFAELLIAEMAEEPRSWRRTLDVVRSGLLARCTVAGLTGHELPPADQFRVSLATLCCAVAVSGALGVFMLAQLATGWQWTVTRSPGTAIGTLIMAARGGRARADRVSRRPSRPAGTRWSRPYAAVTSGSRWPSRVALVCAIVLVLATRHFQNGWPGTGGTGAEHGLVPGGLAAFGWASTLSVSAYWVHPALLGRFPLAELAWMVLSPLAGIGLVGGACAAPRRLELPGSSRAISGARGRGVECRGGVVPGRRGQLGAHAPAGPLATGVPARCGR